MPPGQDRREQHPGGAKEFAAPAPSDVGAREAADINLEEGGATSQGDFLDDVEADWARPAGREAPTRRRERGSRWRRGGGSVSDRGDEEEEILHDLDEPVAPPMGPTGQDVEDEWESEPGERETGEESERPRRRRRRRRRSIDRTAADAGPRKVAPERESFAGSSATRDSDVDEDSTDLRAEGEAGGEDEADEDLAKKPSHRGIVSWEQAIGYIVKANMEARKSSRNGRGGSERSRTGPRDRHGGHRK